VFRHKRPSTPVTAAAAATVRRRILKGRARFRQTKHAQCVHPDGTISCSVYHAPDPSRSSLLVPTHISCFPSFFCMLYYIYISHISLRTTVDPNTATGTMSLRTFFAEFDINTATRTLYIYIFNIVVSTRYARSDGKSSDRCVFRRRGPVFGHVLSSR